MLTWIRSKSSGMLMTVIIGLLILTIALWGVGDYFTQSNNDAVATVNGEKITMNEYNQQFATYRQNLMSQFGEGFDPSYFDSPVMKRNFLESMINNELYKQAALDNGYVVSADEIKSIITDATSFKNENGQFDPALYAAFLTQTNQTAAILEGKIADGLLGTAINDVVDVSVFMTPAEKQAVAELNLQTRDFDYVIISPNQFLADVTLTDEAIQAHYDENQNNFMTQEQVAVDYIELNAETVAAGIEVTDADALSYFEKEENQKAYLKPEQRLASHILLNDGDGAEDQINDLKAQLDAGADFAELAKAHSQDPGSAASGGDLGWVSPGDMVEDFETALFALEAGNVSEPVKTEFGYHLIQLNEIKAPELPVFEAVKDDIIQALQAQQAETLFLDKATELSALVLDAQDNLDQVAESAGLEKKTTALFTRNSGEGLAANADFREAAFSSTVKEELLNSDVINISDTHIVFMHINEVKAAEVKPLDEVKATIENTLKNEQAKALADEEAEKMLAMLNNEEDNLHDLAASLGFEAVEAQAVKRTGSEHPFNLVRNVFKLNKPEAGKVFNSVESGNGNDSVVVQLKAVHAADLTGADMVAETAQLSRNIKANEQQLIISALRESAQVVVNEDLLNQNAF